MRGKFQSICKNHTFLVWTILLVGILYGLISLGNHYAFRTFALDLGLYTNALFDYARFQFNDSLAFKEVPENLLADHFDLYLPLFSPLSYIFGTSTLLIAQIASILFGAIGVYKLVEYWSPATKLKNFALLYFVFFFSIYSALGFDYHSNVVGAMFVPWLFIAIEKNKWKHAWIWIIIICIGKENMSLWLFFICIALVGMHCKSTEKRNHLLMMALFSIIYFVIIIGFVMPAFSNADKYPHFHYQIIGNNFKEAFLHIVTHPVESFKLLFTNHHGDTLHNFVKAELWFYLLSLGFLLFKKPWYLVILLPILGQKLYHNNPLVWGIQYQYSIEFAPLLAIGTFDVLRSLNSQKLRTILSYLMVLLSLTSVIRLMDNTIAQVEKARLRVYKKAHYFREFDLNNAKNALKVIPKDAVVSAQSAFVPHLALRETIYTFPTIKDASYIILSPVENPYPMTDEKEFSLLIHILLNGGEWETIFNSRDILVFKRK